MAETAAAPPRGTAPVWPALLLPGLLAALWWYAPALGRLPEPVSNGTRFPASTLPLTTASPAPGGGPPPWTTNVQFADRNGDGRLDLLTCDARFGRVVSYDARPDGSWKEVVLGSDLLAPAHATLVDLDRDGRLDVVVSVLGSIWPDDSRIGKVVWLRNTGDKYEPRTLLSDVRRVADVQAGDLDGDGDVDLAVAVFGYARGEVLWLENDSQERFTPHTLFRAPGAVHVPLADFDGDGDLDITTVLSQDREQVWGFENLGQGSGGERFAPRLLFESLNFDLGSAGLVKVDLDRDGDLDLLLPVGDNLEDIHSYPQPYHGCYWLENRGGWNFAATRIATLGGTYAAAAGDLDGDLDLDVVLVSMFDDWDRPGHASLVWLENDGRQKFTPRQIETEAIHLVTVDCADVNGDGRADILAAPLHLMAPFQASPSATLWLSPGAGPVRKEGP